MKGCWEMYASSRAALRYYAELAPEAPRIEISSGDSTGLRASLA